MSAVATTYVAREREVTEIPIETVFRDGRFDIRPDVQRRDYFDIRFKGDSLAISAGKYVGLVPLNERVLIQVEPKMPVANMLAMLSAVDGDIVELNALEREYKTGAAAPLPVFQAIVRALIGALRLVEVGGLRKRYVPRVTASQRLVGRIQFNESMQSFWSGGRRHSAVCADFDLTSDVPENRLLRYACHMVLAHHRATGAFKESAGELGHFEEMFARSDVKLERSDPRFLVPAYLSEREPAYSRSIRLAQLVVMGRGVELAGSGTEVALPSFLVNMETLFERYVRYVLARHLEQVEVVDGNFGGSKPLFDNRSTPPANPDIVIRKAGLPVVIGEVKYKGGESRDDVNQVLAYGLSYRVPAVVLILPAESADSRGLADVGTVAHVRVYRYRFDLAASDRFAEERAFAAAIAGI